jgi:peptidoglycan/LPS O-acetylase OafA/YrhL
MVAADERAMDPMSPSDARGSVTHAVRTGPEGGTLRRFSALDGIRALAVLAVLLYHAGIPGMGGGLLGVDVFFVLSGFLITSLLCRELAASATIRLGRFWAQRARRLLPALFVLVLGVAAYAYAFRGTLDLPAVRSDALSTLCYVANWHFIFSDQGYFAQAAAPSPFLHTWSLAVEEQYYLIWPLVVLFVARRWGVSKVALAAAVGALASATTMVVLSGLGASLDRLYYGTDTRAQSLLLGSFLGAVGAHRGRDFAIVPARWTTTDRQRRLWVMPGLLGMAFLAWAWHTLEGTNPFLYRGGFLLVAVAAGAVIVTVVTVPASALARVLSVAPLVFVGRISYGLYLYHWPLFLVIDHAHTGLLGAPLLAVRLAATFSVAIASYYLLEEPIRTGRLFHGVRGLAVTGAAALATTTALIVATVLPLASAGAAPPDRPSKPVPRLSAATVSSSDTPIRFLLVGDSVALTMGMGLGVDVAQRYGVDFLDEGALGCDLDSVPVDLSDVPSPPTPGCLDWWSTWSTWESDFHPDVVGILIGRWEVSDHLDNGQWVHVGEPVWDAHLTAELDTAVNIFSAGGSKVILFTMPYVDPSQEAADGTPFSENDPARARAFNAVLSSVARHRSNEVTLVDVNRMLDPSGQYQAVVDGIPARTSDGIHISVPGGEWLQPQILPTVVALGRAARGQPAPLAAAGGGHPKRRSS